MTTEIVAGMLALALTSGMTAEAQHETLRIPAGGLRSSASRVQSAPRSDSLKNGIGIGAAVALGGYVGLALLTNVRMLGCGADEPGAGIILCLGMVAGAGAAIGGAVDAAHTRQLYTGHVGRATIGVAPVLTPEHGGVRLAVSF